ncbi:hypothetical protein MMC26_005162 [Xylographa opegraphella]|nr:hypothetical protein [Xylographa opegraphella]
MNGHSKALINLLRGWPNAGLLPKAQFRTATAKLLSDPDLSSEGLLYGPLPGIKSLRVELAAWLTRFYKPERSIEWERICISGGASQNLACILQVFSDPVFTRNIWMVSPTYFLACRIFEDSGFVGRLKRVPEDDDGIDIDYLRRGLQQSERDAQSNGNSKPMLKPQRAWNKVYRHIIYAVPTFANPSSKTMSLERRQQLVTVAREYDALIVTDDVYDQLQWTVSSNPSPALKEAVQPRVVDIDRFHEGGVGREGADGFGNAVSSGSFSKIVAPGCRSGWAEGTEKFISGLSNAGSTNSGSAPSQLTASFMTELLASGELENHLYTTLQPSYARRHKIMVDAIKDILLPLGITLPQTERTIVGGYFMWMSLPTPLKADDLAVYAEQEENIIVAPGSLFGVAGDVKDEELEREVRLCFAWVKEDIIRESIERLGRVICRMQDADANGQEISSLVSRKKVVDGRYQ